MIRWASAVVASAVCSAIGLSGANFAYADASRCTLKDVAAWQGHLASPTEEATPGYRLQVTEDFIAACPDRPEVFEAHRLAGLAAADGEQPGAVIDHLMRARTDYRPLEHRAWFSLIAALLEVGEPAQAWKERDALVANWLERLDVDGLAEIQSIDVDGGTIHSVQFVALEPGSYVRGVWLATPRGAGWPSAIVLGSNQFQSSMYKLRAASTVRLEHFDLVGCRDRITLTQSAGEIAFNTANEAALAAAEAYLEHPEQPQDNGLLDMSSLCSWSMEMMPRPDPFTAVLTD